MKKRHLKPQLVILLIAFLVGQETDAMEPVILENTDGKRVKVNLQFASDSKVAFKRNESDETHLVDRSSLSVASNELIKLWRSKSAAITSGNKVPLGVFNHDLWNKLGTKPEFYPWEGRRVVLLTLEDTHDPAGVGKYLHYLDQGWSIMEYVTGGYPKLSEQSKRFSGKGIIRCAPNANYLQAGGLGMIGATDIELSYFYADFWNKPDQGDFNIVKSTPDRIHGYCFYEMGRNFYLWGERHDLFTTGFAVAMRYICLNELGLREPGEDADKLARQKRDFHQVVSKDPKPLNELFLSLGAKEDAVFVDTSLKLLEDKGLVNFYASMIIYGYEKHGGLEWLKAFYENLNKCPRVSTSEPNGVMAQWFSFVVCFNLASHSNMEKITRSGWKIPLSDQSWNALRNVRWESPQLKAHAVFKSIPFGTLPLIMQVLDPRFHDEEDCPPNLLEESGFEVAAISKWTKGQHDHKQEMGAWEQMLFSVNKDAKHGERCYKIEPSFPHYYQIFQDVKVEPKRKYLLSGWIRTENLVSAENDRGASLGFDWFPSTEPILGSNAWTYVTRIVSTDQEVVPVRIRTIGVSGEAWFDDISLLPIPVKYLK